MIFYFKKLETYKLQAKSYRLNKGMSYVELIVVLSIFAVLSSVTMFSYSGFQDKVDLKNLASDIALKIVEAQKVATSGKWNSSAGDGWKPAYGIYFDTNKPTQVVYFADVDVSNKSYDQGEELDTFDIKKGSLISEIKECADSDCISSSLIAEPLAIVFTRLSSGPTISYASEGTKTNFAYVQITIKSPKETTATIKIYSSGRIQVI